MASYCLFMKNDKEFYTKLQERDPDIIIKMTRSIINAIKRKKEKVEIFNISFKDGSELIFDIDKESYFNFLNNAIKDLVKLDEPEMYLLCAEIIKISKPKRKYTKNVKLST